MLRKIILLLSGNAASSLLLFARNLLIARLISPEDYGIAAMFGMILGLIEAASQFGLQQMIMQDNKGEDPRFQATLQGFHLLRSTITALVLFATAGPLSAFMGIPDVAWAFQLLALPRLAFGFLHFDIYRLQRRMSYRPLMAVYVLTPLAALVAVWPLALWFGDYRTMLFSLVIQEFVRMGVSHWVAIRRYSLALDREILRSAISFGWPLLINAIVLALVFNGERIVVGRELGMETLAYFAMGVTLTLTPALVIGRVVESLFLPRLAALKHDPDRFTAVTYGGIQAQIASGVFLTAGTLLIVAPMVTIVLGDKFAPTVPLLLWLILLQAIRDSKGVPLVAMSRGKTRIILWTNLFRVLSLAISWPVAISTGSPVAILWIAAGAELLGLVAGLLLIRHAIGLDLKPLLPGYVAAGFFYAMLAVYGMQSQYDLNLPLSQPATVGLLAIAFCVTLFSLRSLWRNLRETLSVQRGPQ